MRKKSSRRPTSSRPQDTTMSGDDNNNNPSFISQHVQTIDDQDHDSIQRLNDQNPNPNPNPMSNEEDKPQSDGEGVDGDLDPEINEGEVGDQDSRKALKRKEKRKPWLGLEKKFKQDPIPEEDSSNHHTPPTDDNQNFEKATNLEQPQGDQPIAPSVSSRKTPKRKKMNARQKAALEKKLNLIKKNLKPIPFVPEKKLDFSKHEQLFQRLGLWDFVNMEFDQDIRSDLITMLIANYNPTQHYSIVNDLRIKLTRADLARALKLPVKKDKSVSLETSDFDSETLSQESISFIGEFLHNWILLHEDTWILPNEVVSWHDLIKNGEPHKVDWPRFIWYMVEKELTQAPEIGTLYFASHIQCLIKSQRNDLFKEKPLLEVPVEVEDDFDLKIGSSKDYEGLEFEKQQTELCLGQNESKEQYEQEDTMDYQESKQEPGGQAQWFSDEKNYVNNHCLQRCTTSEAQNQQSQHGIEEVEDEEYDPQPNCSTLGGLASNDLFQEIGTTSVTYSPSFRIPGHSSGDIFQSGIDAHLNSGGMFMHVNSFKSEAGRDDIEYHHSFSDHHNHKQMMSDASPPDFNLYIEQIHCLANKAKEMYEEKEKASLNANMNEELLSDLQHQNETLISYLQKTRSELEKREMENYKLERELLVMSNLLEGYRNALKENRRAFSEYRERNPQPEEPLYKDAGPGGLVLSTTELEKQRLEREEEEKIKRCMIKQVVADFEAGWLEIFEGYKCRVHELEQRLLELEEKVKLYKVMCKAEDGRDVVNEV